MKKLIPCLMLLLLPLAACGGRVPSQAKTASIAKKYFSKYGKKYKETVFYTTPVASVEVKDVQELQKNIATSFMLLKMNDGSEIPVIMTLIRKQPLGWRTSGWEQARQ
ncbi:MAG: hypothetical protein U1F66_13315 [bacterium]